MSIQSGRWALRILFIFIMLNSFTVVAAASESRKSTKLFDKGWRFHLGDANDGQTPSLDDSQWRLLNVPHDWSIEGKCSEDNPAGVGGGALPGGIAWYRKTFTLPESYKSKLTFVQ